LKESLAWIGSFSAGFLAAFFVTRLVVVTLGFSATGASTAAGTTGSTATALWSMVFAGSTAGVPGSANGIAWSGSTGLTASGAAGGGAALASCAETTAAAVVKRSAAMNKRTVVPMSSSFADRKSGRDATARRLAFSSTVRSGFVRGVWQRASEARTQSVYHRLAAWHGR